jgi:tetratricopeptide (TPR) repeat protein
VSSAIGQNAAWDGGGSSPEVTLGRPSVWRSLQPALAVAGALLTASAWFQPSVAGSDLWWHLASGREIWSRGAPPTTDPFSYTFAGREWLNHEWLWDFLYWGLYQVHPQLVPLAHFAVLVATYSVALRVAWRMSGSLAAATLALWAAAPSAHWFLDLRPHVYSLLFAVCVLATSDSPRRFWLWPALSVVWTNVHAGFVFGVGAVGLRAVVATAKASAQSGRLSLPRRDWLCVAGSAMAVLINPWGWRILEYPLAYLPGFSHTLYQSLVEWQPTGLGIQNFEARGLAGWCLTFQARFWFVAALTALGVLRGARERPYVLALAAIAFLMAVRSRRFIPLFGICAMPVAALGLADAWLWLRTRVPALGSAGARALATTATLALGALLWRHVGIWPDLLGHWTQRDLYPEAAVRYLNALGPPPRVLNYYNWGGYLMLHAPGVRVFIDGRANTLYNEQILRDYTEMLSGADGLRARVDAYRAELALLPDSAFATGLQRLAPPWRVIYRDATAILLAPADSPLLRQALPDPEQLLADDPQFLRYQGQQAWNAGQLDLAIARLERAIALDPQQVGAYGDLAGVLRAQGDADGSGRAIERGIAAAPRRGGELRGIEGTLLLATGQLEPALKALRAALPTGPFSDPTSMAQRVEFVLNALRRQSAGTPG